MSETRWLIAGAVVLSLLLAVAWWLSSESTGVPPPGVAAAEVVADRSTPVTVNASEPAASTNSSVYKKEFTKTAVNSGSVLPPSSLSESMDVPGVDAFKRAVDQGANDSRVGISFGPDQGTTGDAPLASVVELSPWQSPPVSVPPGERLPALFYDTRPLPLPQRSVLDSIANNFIDAVSGAGNSGETAEVWEAARAEADRRYKILYGFADYDLMMRAAALEGMNEKKVLTDQER